MRRAIAIGAAALVVRGVLAEGPSAFAHNVVGHPLLALVPPLGEAIHARTDPEPRAVRLLSIDWSGLDRDRSMMDTPGAGGHDGALPGPEEE